MDLLHTSPSEITSITNKGRFGEFLFFSTSEYVMTAGSHVTYKLNIVDSEIISASELFYSDNASELAELVSEISDRYEISEEDAEALIEETTSIYDIESNVEAEDLADASWDIQLATARAAKVLGFRGVRVNDEQGSSYMIDMLGREAELVRI